MITSNFNAILIDNIRTTYVPFPLFIALKLCLLTIMNTGNLCLCLWKLLRSQRQVISQQKRWNSNFYWDNVDNILYFVCANRIQNYKSGLLIVVSQVIFQQKRWNSNLFWLHHLRVETTLCTFFFREVSIGKFAKISTSPFIFTFTFKFV